MTEMTSGLTTIELRHRAEQLVDEASRKLGAQRSSPLHAGERLAARSEFTLYALAASALRTGMKISAPEGVILSRREAKTLRDTALDLISAQETALPATENPTNRFAMPLKPVTAGQVYYDTLTEARAEIDILRIAAEALRPELPVDAAQPV